MQNTTRARPNNLAHKPHPKKPGQGGKGARKEGKRRSNGQGQMGKHCKEQQVPAAEVHHNTRAHKTHTAIAPTRRPQNTAQTPGGAQNNTRARPDHGARKCSPTRKGSGGPAKATCMEVATCRQGKPAAKHRASKESTIQEKQPRSGARQKPWRPHALNTCSAAACWKPGGTQPYRRIPLKPAARNSRDLTGWLEARKEGGQKPDSQLNPKERRNPSKASCCSSPARTEGPSPRCPPATFGPVAYWLSK